MKSKLLAGVLTGLLMQGVVCLNPAFATTWMIGDNDGYGMALPDNADHPFNGYTANYDGRSPAEVLATNGAQYTDTYSTTHSGYGPQPGSVAIFTFTGLGNGWTEGSMWFDMADFQASTFGAVNVAYNGIVQNWSFNDGFPHTTVRYFDLDQNVIDSINTFGLLTVSIDRNYSVDFYGFDYALLSDNVGAETNPYPEPSTIMLFGLGLVSMSVARSGLNKRVSA
ncbi:MAG: PEP-CTERM sorting domain-containing protein [Chlorobiaceae bacterium]|jgi:hypothetical protein|nr:PEP-CTERM sorting domain-containing protein [Chlorobiaceae bacterium]